MSVSIHTIPTEIVSEILEYVVHSIPNPPNSLSDYAAPWILARVCSNWCHQVLTLPSLWKRFSVDNTDYITSAESSLARLKAWLAKTAQCELEITVRFRSQVKVHGPGTLMNELIQHASRWRSIDLQGWGPGLGFPPNGASLAALTELRLMHDGWPCCSFRAADVAKLLTSQQQLPNLKHLTFCPLDTDADFDGLDTLLAKTSYSLSSFTAHGFLAMSARLVKSLTTLPQLQALNMKGCSHHSEEFHDALCDKQLVPHLEQLHIDVWEEPCIGVGVSSHEYDHEGLVQVLKSRAATALNAVQLTAPAVTTTKLLDREDTTGLREQGLDLTVITRNPIVSYIDDGEWENWEDDEDYHYVDPFE